MASAPRSPLHVARQLSLLDALALAGVLATTALLMEVVLAWRIGAHYARGLLLTGSSLPLWGSYLGAFGLCSLIGLGAARAFLRGSRTQLVDSVVLVVGLGLCLSAAAMFSASPVFRFEESTNLGATAAVSCTAVAAIVVIHRLLPAVGSRVALVLLLSFPVMLLGAVALTRYHTITGLLGSGLVPLLCVAVASLLVGSATTVILLRDAAKEGRGLLVTSLVLVVGTGIAALAFEQVAGLAEEPAAATATNAGSNRTNVLLVILDTMRGDYIGAAQGPDGLTPQIDAFATEGVVFLRAISTAPWTMPAFGSILSSTYPTVHGAGSRSQLTGRRVPFSADVPSIAEVLGESGYATAAVTTNPFMGRRYGYGRGFDSYENLVDIYYYHPIMNTIRVAMGVRRPGYVMAEFQVARALDAVTRLAAAEQPFFLIAHVMDAHRPYQAPEEYYDGPIENASTVDRYRAEVRYMDFWIGHFFQELKSRGLYDDMLIVLTADHGEELTEARDVENPWSAMHGHSLYQEALHVPLIVKLPGGERAGTRQASLVSLLDVAPTILGLVSVGAPEGYQGTRLLDEKSEVARDRVLVAESLVSDTEQKAAIQGFKKVILESDLSGEAFDLEADPLEQNPMPLAGAGPELRALVEPLARHFRAAASDNREGVALSPELESQLRALGYSE